MVEWMLDPDIEGQLDRDLEDAKNQPDRPMAVRAEYNRDFDMIILRLDTGRRLLIPREELQGLENASESQLSQIEIHAGVDIAWPQLDVDHYLPHLLEGKYASERWQQSREAAKNASAAA